MPSEPSRAQLELKDEATKEQRGDGASVAHDRGSFGSKRGPQGAGKSWARKLPDAVPHRVSLRAWKRGTVSRCDGRDIRLWRWKLQRGPAGQHSDDGSKSWTLFGRFRGCPESEYRVSSHFIERRGGRVVEGTRLLIW